MFSGQGSHYYQMGRELFEINPIFKHWMQKGEQIYQDLTGVSLIQELYHPQHKRSDSFTQILYTNPAIFMVEYALAQVLLAEGITPHAVLGTSLGEFTAATIAGVFSFETALEIVIKTAKITAEKCPLGKMTAILHTPSLYDDCNINPHAELAAINFASHIVISGELDGMEKIETYLKKQQLTYQNLMVNYGFHSAAIDTLAGEFIGYMQNQTLHPPKLPFISATKSQQLDIIPAPYFWEVIRRPIHFQNTIQKLENENNYIYLDVGPTGTLANFAKYNFSPLSQSKTLATLVPFNLVAPNFTNLREAVNC